LGGGYLVLGIAVTTIILIGLHFEDPGSREDPFERSE
jgi:hypothetical protein